MELEKLLEILRVATGTQYIEQKINENTTLKELGINSISLIQTIVLIEEELQCEISEEMILLEPFITVNDLLVLVQKNS